MTARCCVPWKLWLAAVSVAHGGTLWAVTVSSHIRYSQPTRRSRKLSQNLHFWECTACRKQHGCSISGALVDCRDLGVGDDDQYEVCVANADSSVSDARNFFLTAKTVYHIVPANCAIERRDDASDVLSCILRCTTRRWPCMRTISHAASTSEARV